MAYLEDNPPVRSQFVCPRREAPSGVVVVHTAESTPDFVAFDGGAEAVAKFIRGRSDPGSYHDLADSDSCINLVSYGCEAFHDGTGSNRHSYGVSAATRADVWPLAPQAWRDGCIYQMAAAAARYATWLRATNGVVIPARRITRVESEARVPGFISHAERDPTRRTDPGAGFPWAQFLATFDRLTDPQEDDSMSAEDVAQITNYLDTKLRPFLCLASNGTDPAVVIVRRDGTAVWVKDEAGMKAARKDGVNHASVDADGLPVPFKVRTLAELQALTFVGDRPPGW